ncbi:MAG TPA: 2-octaprenyl-3-methyl-6-methoxy-1,4-benzoquinol hydroxylase, partial [Gammaproteobacteria bacterium]|nr:2-octaprenyl-3-methyl-6-methoxy-1,4-benzoquinol hydroxylase [Gammaproteobacteria bacterium]
MSQFDVVIVGGGMVGQAFALSMAQKTNASIAIIEPNNPRPKLGKDFHTR